MQLPDISSDQPLADELARVLAAHGPLTYEQVSESFGEAPTTPSGKTGSMDPPSTRWN